jgi:hypothetical protein
MFFNIGQKKLDNFPKNYQHNNLYINLDEGWHESQDQHGNILFYKGYVDSANIEDVLLEIAEQEEPKFYGNFCLIKCFNQGVAIKADQLRSFPIWYDIHSGLTNLTSLKSQVWTDSVVMIQNNGKLVESKFKYLDSIESITLTLAQAVDQVDAILSDKIQKFTQHNSLPLKVFLSGGIDTGLLYSYILKYNIPHELIDCEHIDFDYFYLKNRFAIRNFWGYEQIHHWRESCVLVSGAPGDEFTVRSPTTANMLMRFHGTSIPELLANSGYSNSLHYTYFNNPTYLKMWSKDTRTWKIREEVILDCINLIVNDYQHWHLGNTLTYTPLRDIRIFEIIARLEKESLTDQVMNSRVQVEIIKRNHPELLKYLASQKNFNNMSNLTGILLK